VTLIPLGRVSVSIRAEPSTYSLPTSGLPASLSVRLAAKHQVALPPFTDITSGTPDGSTAGLNVTATRLLFFVSPPRPGTTGQRSLWITRFRSTPECVAAIVGLQSLSFGKQRSHQQRVQSPGNPAMSSHHWSHPLSPRPRYCGERTACHDPGHGSSQGSSITFCLKRAIATYSFSHQSPRIH